MKIDPAGASGGIHDIDNDFVTFCYNLFSITSIGEREKNMYSQNSSKHVVWHKDVPFGS